MPLRIRLLDVLKALRRWHSARVIRLLQFYVRVPSMLLLCPGPSLADLFAAHARIVVRAQQDCYAMPAWTPSGLYVLYITTTGYVCPRTATETMCSCTYGLSYSLELEHTPATSVCFVPQFMGRREIPSLLLHVLDSRRKTLVYDTEFFIRRNHPDLRQYNYGLRRSVEIISQSRFIMLNNIPRTVSASS
jgi:hypothetical protein